VTVLVIRRSTFVGLFVYSVPNKGDVLYEEETTQNLCRNNKMRDAGEYGIKQDSSRS
jgi:hypothetical protein